MAHHPLHPASRVAPASGRVLVAPRWRKIQRELLGNRLRSTLVILSIAVGVFAVTTAAGSRAILSRELASNYAATNPPGAILTTDPFDDELVETIRRLPEVRDAEGRSRLTVRMMIGPGEWRDLYLFAIPDYSNITISKVRPVSGAWPPPEHDLLIERAALPLTKVGVGGELLVEMADGKRRRLRIAGLAHDLYRQPAQIENTAYGYITFATLEWLGKSREYDELHFTVTGHALDREHVRLVAEKVSDKVEQSGRTVYAKDVPRPGKHELDDAMQTILLLLAVFAGISLLLSGFLVVNTISSLLGRQVRQIAVMKAIGARTDQIVGMYLAMVLGFGLAALALGVPLGMLGAQVVSRFVAGLINFDVVDGSIPASVLGLAALVGLAVPPCAAIPVILRTARITVREAISTQGLAGSSEGGGSRRAARHLRLLPRPLLLSLRSTFANKRRLALTLTTLTLASASFVSVASVSDSLDLSLERSFGYWAHDVEVYLSQPYRIDRIAAAAAQTPGVVSAEPMSLSSTRRVRLDGREGETLLLYAVPPDTPTIRPRLLDGRWLVPEDEHALVISNTFLQEEPDVRVGDEVLLKLDGREVPFQVVGNVHLAMSDGPTVYASYAHVARATGASGRANGARIVTAEHDIASQYAAARSLEESLRAADLHVGSILTIAELRRSLGALFSSITALLMIMSATLAAVGGLGLAGMLSASVLERTREIGVMRAIGASDRAVQQMVVVEGVLVGLLSYVVGLALSLPLGMLLADAVGRALFQAPLDYTFSAMGAIAWLGAVLVLAALASYLPARTASQLTVREVLAYE